MREDKTYPRLRGTKPKFKKSRELRKQMSYNTITNDESKRFKYFTIPETKDNYLVQHILSLEEIKL